MKKGVFFIYCDIFDCTNNLRSRELLTCPLNFQKKN